MVFKNVLLSVLLSSMLVSVNAIRCYQCNSIENAECQDLGTYRPHLTAGFYKECEYPTGYNASEIFCRKTVLSVMFSKDETRDRTVRSCGWIKSHLPCYKADNDDHLETSCQCFEDGCNGSNQVKVFSLYALMFASLVFKLIF